MKIEIISVKTQKLFELYLIKTGVYRQALKKNDKHFSSKDLTTIMLQFKKALQVIFKYHKHHKKIRFIGAPQSLENTINFSSPHTAIPVSFNLKSFSMNDVNSEQRQASNLSKTENLSFFLKLNQKPDLIVFFENKHKSSFSLKESFTAKIPTIVLNHEVTEYPQKPSYTVFGSAQTEGKNTLNNLLSIVFKATLGRFEKKDASAKKKT